MQQFENCGKFVDFKYSKIKNVNDEYYVRLFFLQNLRIPFSDFFLYLVLNSDQRIQD